MKISDILENVTNLKQKAFLAMRIRHCEPLIKKAIADLHSKGSFEPIEYNIQLKDASITSISTSDLRVIYGMDSLKALLFLDAIVKADSKEDKAHLVNMLQALTAGKHRTNFVVTPEMLEKVKTSNPDVWSHYQKLCEEAQQREDAAVREMDDNLNEELD